VEIGKCENVKICGTPEIGALKRGNGEERWGDLETYGHRERGRAELRRLKN
jgi:hypothetical protein